MKQFVFFQQNKVHYKNYGLLLIICLLAYWPLTFGVFSVKNDAIHYFLPYRFNISEAIRHGEMPFWSPYIYLGNPVYGDMQSGAWNPVVWIFSAIGRYDITLFHFENLLYIFLAGMGMYKLVNRLTQHTQTALLIAVSYMLSGFMLGGQLINWLAAAAFFPFVIHYYLQTLKSASLSNGVKTGVALYLLLTAGYPSFFITTGYILLLLFIITVITRFKNKEDITVSWTRLLLNQLLIAAVFTGLALPAIVSYIDLLPYYSRGSGTTYYDTLSNSFEWQHLLSLIYPTAVKANNIVSATDITCRSVYMGIFPVVILAAFRPKLSRRNILLILLIVFSLLFSLGDATPVRKLCYDLLPGMNTFRHPSQMRLFFIFALLLLAMPGVKSFLKNSDARKKTKSTVLIFIALIGIAVITALFDPGIFKQLRAFSFSQARIALKNMIDSASLSDTLFINGLIQLVFLITFFLLLKKVNRAGKAFAFLWITNLFVLAQFALPISFVSKTPAREINKLIHASPAGFPIANLEHSLDSNSKDALNNFDKISLACFYNKKIGISRIAYSPSFLKEQDDFLNSILLYKYVASKPVVYLADSVLQTGDSSVLKTGKCNYATTALPLVVADSCSNANKAIIKKISSNYFEIEADTYSTCMLVLTQSYHHYWKANVDGLNMPIYKVNTGFMGIVIPAGKHKVVFRFVPVNTIKAIWVMLGTLAVLIVLGIVSLIRRNNHRPV